MEQHPVPQHIASYEFRLVGNMTLKQFGYLAGGAIVALVFYGTRLPGLIKWFLIILSGFTGFALAFMPIEERPLQVWIISFFKSIFSPTQFIWEKKAQVPDFWKREITEKDLAPAKVEPTDKSKLQAYLQTLPGTQIGDLFAQQEMASLQKIKQMFQASQPVLQPQTTSFSFPPVEPLLKPEPAVKTKPLPKPEPAPLPARPKTPFPFNPIKQQRYVVGATSSLDLPIPAPPTQANVLVGMTLTKNNEIIEGAILEIRNSENVPVRALKTNKLGQFRIATPLENGTYEIEIEKEGSQFDIIKLEAKGEIIQPIEIKAK